MINFVVAGLVLRDFVLGVRLSFKPCWHCSHLLCVAGNTHVLSGNVECVTRRKLRIGLFGEDGLSEKQEDQAAKNVHRRVFSGAGRGLEQVRILLDPYAE